MSEPITFTPEEQEALEKIDNLTKALTKVDQDIERINRRILREKAEKDKLTLRKESIESKIRGALSIIDTLKNQGSP